LALLTVCAAVPLLLLGAEVTTKKVGMVDDKGFREPWHLLVILDQALTQLGLLIEHSHRTMGFLVGTCAIALAISLWLREPRRLVRWLGVAVLTGVCVQGLLGIFRVNLNALMGRELALVHGCFAQLVFALMISLALCTSRGWFVVVPEEDSPRIRRWSLIVMGLIYLQLVLGAFVRHLSTPLSQRGHLLAAFAVVAAVAWLGKLVYETRTGHKSLARTITLLAFLVGLQVLLGIETWMLKFAAGTAMADLQPIGPREEILRTAHYFVGSAVFATSVAFVFRAHRHAALAMLAPATARQLEGVG
jgi:heme A synthase